MVNVNVPEPVVYVQPPEVTVESPQVQVDVHVPESKPVTKRIVRDAQGAIVRIEET